MLRQPHVGQEGKGKSDRVAPNVVRVCKGIRPSGPSHVPEDVGSGFKQDRIDLPAATGTLFNRVPFPSQLRHACSKAHLPGPPSTFPRLYLGATTVRVGSIF